MDRKSSSDMTLLNSLSMLHEIKESFGPEDACDATSIFSMGGLQPTISWGDEKKTYTYY
jgi:hypothetical protein